MKSTHDQQLPNLNCEAQMAFPCGNEGSRPSDGAELQCPDRGVRIVDLHFEEMANDDCVDTRYGCTCISHERCCGCLLQ